MEGVQVTQEVTEARQTDPGYRDMRDLSSMGLRPKSFNGSGEEDINKFFAKFERLAVYGQWSDGKKAIVLPMLLEDGAYHFYEALSDDAKGNYGTLKAALTQHYTPNISKLIRWNRLHQKRMTVDQTV